MKADTPHYFFQELKDDSLSFIYQGSFSDEITDMVVDLTENYLPTGGFAKMRKKVSFLMVECFQNVIRHGDKADLSHPELSTGLFITRNLGDTFYITSANLIENVNVPYLKEKLESVNILDKEDLKSLYLDILENKELSAKGGASVGLIEIARKSGQKLEFYFEAADEKYSYFYLQIKIKSQNPTDKDFSDVSISYILEFHHLIDLENIFLIHRGNFSHAAIKPVLRMIENNIQAQVKHHTQQKIVYHLMVEILQNISDHAYQIDSNRDGIIVMGYKNQKYAIGAGNYIENEKIENFKNTLTVLTHFSKDELNEMYKMNLKGGNFLIDGIGLGMIDIVRESNGVEYQFFPVNEIYSFFSLIVLL